MIEEENDFMLRQQISSYEHSDSSPLALKPMQDVHMWQERHVHKLTLESNTDSLNSEEMREQIDLEKNEVLADPLVYPSVDSLAEDVRFKSSD